MMERALQSMTSDSAILGTVKNLDPSHVVPLLEFLSVLFESHWRRIPTLVVWIRSIMQRHAALLMGAPKVHESLSMILQTVENRVKTHDRLVELEARLQRVAHRSRKSSIERIESIEFQDPLVLFDDKFAAVPEAKFVTSETLNRNTDGGHYSTIAEKDEGVVDSDVNDNLPPSSSGEDDSMEA
eukprot:CAMPEP_0182447472 /NCGR_PEP_ID=MMETSP1172-20130603/16357_1 /TAXON_ID=708627 /ORGANISM="Timspurckia oligopyrenoides, Strain CCMP3278" /LENGTH=183 /DNA_ID=CAMNT_0024643917 /DNA_START=1 /DNA_END=552 /DNA_ORIENTATION=-